MPSIGDGFWRAQVASCDEQDEEEPTVLPQELARVWLAVCKQAGLKQNHMVERQELSIHEFMSEIIRRLEKERFVEFRSFLSQSPTRQAQVVSFLAILELSREGLISVTQAAPYAPIYLCKKVLATGDLFDGLSES